MRWYPKAKKVPTYIAESGCTERAIAYGSVANAITMGTRMAMRMGRLRWLSSRSGVMA